MISRPITHVLITRPREASLQLAGQLEETGLHPIVMPLYTFSPLEPGADAQKALSGHQGRKLAVFTSTRAVEYGYRHIPADILDKLEFAAVGDATREKLEARGCKVQLRACTGYTSEDLLSVPELAENPGEAVIFCAPGGRDALAKGLEALGWNVVNALVYQRLQLLPQQQQLDEIIAADGLLSIWTSISALDLAQKHLSAAAWAKILEAPGLVISARIKHHLHQQGGSDVELADGPGNAELLRSIRRFVG